MTDGVAPVPTGSAVDPGVLAEITALLVAADECASRRDPDAYAALFLEDGRMTGSQGDAVGRTALRERVAAVWAGEPRGSLHLTLNPVVGAPEGDRVAAASRLLVLDPATNAVIATAAVRHELRRVDGRWRFALREVG